MSRRPEITIRVQREDFDAAAEQRLLIANRSDVGAVVSFCGICRDEDGSLAALELEHYPGMAEKELRRIAETCTDRWPLLAMTVVHRYGRLVPGDNIVLVVAISAHRSAAFDSASFVMDFLKTQAPFWKRQHLAGGTPGEWVESKTSDDLAVERWK